MRVVLLAALALALAASAHAAPPRAGVFAPGSGLAGVELGATPQQVRAQWGSRFGRCRDCAAQTWYFNLRPFRPQGAGVEFRNGRAAAIFTLWAPSGWRTARGLTIGENVARVTQVYGPMARVECGTYYALTLPAGRATSAFYVVDEELWGFGLMGPGRPVCR